MQFLIRILIVTLAVTLTLLAKESEARSNKRWIQGTGFGGSQDVEDLRDEDVSELTRRDAQSQETQSQQTQQETQQGQSPQDKDKLEYPAFPTGFADEGDQLQTTVASEFDQQEPSGNDDQQSGGDKDRLDQGTETLDQTQDYGSKGYTQPKEPISEQNAVEEDKPWYKKVGHFFKKHYTTIKDSLRGRRNDYYYSE